MIIVALVCGAVLGGILRFTFARISTRYRNRAEYGTLAANVLACFLAGMVAHAFVKEPSGANAQHYFYVFALTGGAGALSTWSTLAGELVTLAKSSRKEAVIYLSATLILGVAAALIAFALPPFVRF